jgi:hypothetical protein
MSGLSIPLQEISFGPNEVPQQPIPRLVYPVQGAAWRRGDIIANQAVGTVVSPPASAGALAGVAGPALSAITITDATTAGAPALTYFIIATYDDGAGNQSNPSQEIVYNSKAGTTPQVSVASAGAPAGAADWDLYVGLFSGGECLQNEAVIALGASDTVEYPLDNCPGANLCPTNPANTVGILGFADVASNAVFAAGYPGSTFTSPMPAFGPSDSVPPNSPPEVNQIPVISLANNLLIEINLKKTTPYWPTLDGTPAGLAYDTASGFWYADPGGSNKALHLVTAVSGAPTVNPLTGAPVGSNPGSFGDFGVRMIASVDPTFLA